jgi:hypothetical protein
LLKNHLFCSVRFLTLRLLPWLTITICCGALSTVALAQTKSQTPQLISTADPIGLIKDWMEKSRNGVRNMIAQENSVSREIEVGFARLQKSCELAAALKANTPKVDERLIDAIVQQFDERLANVAVARKEVVSNAQTLLSNLNANSPANCGLFSRDALPCQIYKYKKEMAQYLLVSANAYYDILDKRYQLYKAISLETRKQCIRPDFLTRLRNADEEYLVVYELKSSKAFLSLLRSVQDLSINQATQ